MNLIAKYIDQIVSEDLYFPPFPEVFVSLKNNTVSFTNDAGRKITMEIHGIETPPSYYMFSFDDESSIYNKKPIEINKDFTVIAICQSHSLSLPALNPLSTSWYNIVELTCFVEQLNNNIILQCVI